MKKVRNWFKQRWAKVTSIASVAMASASVAFSAAAAGEGVATTSTIIDAFKTGAQTMVTDTMGAVAAIVPIAIPLLGVSILVAYVIKFIKRVTKS